MKNENMQRIYIAWGLGWIMYMFLMVLTVYDGIGSMICQPFIALIFSGIFVAASKLVGLILAIPFLKSKWNEYKYVAISIFIIGFILFLFTWELGFTIQEISINTGEPRDVVNPWVTYFGYFLMIFSLVNFPHRSHKSKQKINGLHGK